MNKDSGSLYHLSETNLDGKILTPKVPSNYLVDNGFEDNTTKRVCFSTTIDGALAGLSKNLKDKEFFVHILDDKVSIKVPSEKDVPDVKITHERWALANVKVKCIGKIKVGEAKDKPLTYKYGDKTAELYYWNWDWIKAFNVKESEEFSSKLNKNDILDILRKFKYNKSEYCIVYKASLVMQGVIDKCNDVDICISKKLHNQLIKDGYKPAVAPLGGPKFTINDRLECFTEDSYMTDAVKVNGYNCKSINHCLDEYKRRNRPKDQSTIKRIEDYLAESCKDLSEARKFVSEVKDIAKKYDANFFIVTDGASGYSNDGTNDAVKNAREAQKKWEKEKGFDPDEDWSKDSDVNESVIFDDKKIFHNKDKWDSGEINIVFITGHSGAAKSTTGAKMATESYSLDDVIEQYRFTDANFKEYGDLISSYFKGPGKEYRMSLEEIQKTTTEKTYEIPVLNKFIDYAIKYAKSHKDKKFCIEGIQLFQWFEPSRFKDYPVIILGTSVLKSNHRASLRDAQDADNKLQKVGAYTKNILSPKHYINYLDDEKYLKKWRDYYKDDVVTEIARSDIKDSSLEKGDSCYNLDKWPKEYNILFITGISGSGKSTLGVSMSKEFKCYRVELDFIAVYYLRKMHERNKTDHYYNMLKSECPDAVEFLDKNPVEKLGLREKWSDTGDILTKFCTWFVNKVKGNGKAYIVNGAYLYQVFNPSFFYDKPIIIKDINIVKTTYRRVKREFIDFDDSFFNKLESAYKALKTSLSKQYRDANKDFKKFDKDMKNNAEYVESANDNIVEESLATAVDDVISKAEAKASYNKDYKDMMKLDGIRHPNKIADKVLKTSDKAVDKTMRTLDKPADAINKGANKAIHKTVGGGISFYNKFAKKKIEAEKRREIEAKAGVAVKGTAFMATKLIPMGPVDWTLNLIAVTKVPKSDDPIDKEVQKVANKAKETLTDFRKELKHYAEEDRKYATAKQQIKDIERIEGKYEPITKKLALMMDNINKKKENAKSNANSSKLKPAYESTMDISVYTEKFDNILLSSSGRLLESSYDLLYDFIYEDGNENYPIYEIVNHYLSI